MDEEIIYEERQDSDAQVIDEAMACSIAGSHKCIYKPGSPRHDLWTLTRYRHDIGKKITPPERPRAVKMAALKFMAGKRLTPLKTTTRPALGKVCKG